MRTRRWQKAALIGLTASFAACSSGGGSSSEPAATSAATPSPATGQAAPSSGTVTLRLSGSFTSYNSSTAEENSGWNQEVINAVQPSVAKFDDQANVVIDQNLVTVAKTSDLPLTVDYAFNPSAVWEDGQPVGCDDMYLAWIANNGASTAVDAAGETTGLFHTASTTGWDQVDSVSCSPDGHTVTYTYATPFADWKALVTDLVPAHVVASHSGLDSAAGIRTAYEAGDAAALARIAEFWNTGFTTVAGIDPAVHLSAGPYRIASFEADQSVTLERNDHYWGPRPSIDKIVFRVITDGTAQVQALANGEVQVIQTGGPQPDIMALLGKIQGVTTKVSGANSFEHFDFNFQVPLLQNKAVRQAVAQCMPRREILDKLIIPTDSNAVLQQNRLLFSGQTGYTDTSGGRYDAVDIAGAKATLEADGWVLDGAVYAKGGQPLEFKLLHSASRSEEAQLIQASCAQAGISIIDDNDPGWGPRLGSGQFDAVLFTWNLSPTTSSQKSVYTTAPSPENLLSNYGSYSNPTVDALMDQLATGTDPTTLIATANEVDTMLWSDLATIPLWRLPQVTAYSDHVQGVKPNPTDQGLTWNIETWTLS